VLFAVPYEQRETSDEDPNSTIVWRLEVTADIPGVDYLATFDVPVFKTEDSTPGFKLDRSATKAFEVKRDTDDVLRASKVIVERPGPDRLSLYFPRAARPGSSLIVTGVFVVWTGVTVVLAKSAAPMIFPIVFGLFDALIFFGVIDAWLGWGRIDVERGMLSLTNGYAGGKTVTLKTEEIEAITAAAGQQEGTATQQQVVVRTKDGRTLRAGRPLIDRSAAQVLVEELNRALARTTATIS
jgi:hypothetical protein